MSSGLARLSEFVLSDAEFDALRKLVKEVTGISLADSKRQLVHGRLSRRLRALGMSSFADYHDMLRTQEGMSEIGEFTNAITTNLTSFFRESHHFDYFKDQFLLPRVADGSGSRRIRVWCCAASTGEEPYSIAMSVAEAIPDWERWDIQVLATDIDTEVLDQCRRGVYKADRFKGMSSTRINKFFDPVGSDGSLRVKASLARMIHFRQLNLMHKLPLRGPLDVIFCRNVIIYFDKPTQKELFQRMAPLQQKGALMFLGHSESLFKVSESWSLIGKTIYRRNEH